jgi:hypothetical protein
MFFMGHKGDIEARYSCNKARLPPEMVEQMRAAYAKASNLMQTRTPESDKENVRKALMEQLLFVAGFKRDEVEKMILDEMSDDQLQSIIRQKLLGAMSANGSRQKVISIDEVKDYIRQGFEYVASLPNDEAIVKMPF